MPCPAPGATEFPGPEGDAEEVVLICLVWTKGMWNVEELAAGWTLEVGPGLEEEEAGLGIVGLLF
jgi:hypothetical protein